MNYRCLWCSDSGAVHDALGKYHGQCTECAAATAQKPAKEAGTDTEGSGGYGCACLDRDSLQCAAIRYGMDHGGECCECLCHRWSDEEEDAQCLHS